MQRFPKPFFRKTRNRWTVQLHGKQVNLGPDRDEAFRRYYELMGGQPGTLTSLTAKTVVEARIIHSESSIADPMIAKRVDRSGPVACAGEGAPPPYPRSIFSSCHALYPVQQEATAGRLQTCCRMCSK